METKTITFFSYKGGAGRSSTALNTLPYLVDALYANKDAPVLVLDMDLDSAGMTYLLDEHRYFQNEDNYSMYEFLSGELFPTNSASGSIQTHSFYKKLRPVGNRLGVEHEAVLFLGVDDIHLNRHLENKDMGGKDAIFQRLDEFCYNNNVKAVVIDSSTGTQPSAWVSVGAANLVVMCLRVTTQFRIGTFNYLNMLRKDKKIKTNVLLLPTVVPDKDMDIEDKDQRRAAVEEIINTIKEDKLENIITDFVNYETLGINEVERFKWREGVLYERAKTNPLTAEDEKKAVERYKKLAQRIAAGAYE